MLAARPLPQGRIAPPVQRFEILRARSLMETSVEAMRATGKASIGRPPPYFNRPGDNF